MTGIPLPAHPAIGHKTVRDSLVRLVKKDRLPSTILFAGISGIGKRQIALGLAKTILCEEPSTKKTYGGCGQCPTCKVVASGNFPDLYRIECSDKETWGVDGIKDLLYSLNLTSFSGRGRVIIFNDAEFLQAASANSLLKSLEEPRSNTWFILVTSNPGKLPLTIVSRSQVWNFNPLSDEETRQVLQEGGFELSKKLSEENKLPLDELVVLADGAPGSIGEIQAHGETWSEFRETIQAIYKGDVQFAVQFANTLSKDKENLPSALKLLRIALRIEMRTNPNQPRWAIALSNIIAADRCIFERNLAPATVLSVALLSLTPPEKGVPYTALTNSVTLLDRVTL